MKKHSLKKVDIIDKLMLSLEMRHKDAVDFYEAFFQELEEALIYEGFVKITSFASFIVTQKKKRMGRNPKTQEPAVIIPRKAVLFHPSQYLRDSIREGLKKKKIDDAA